MPADQRSRLDNHQSTLPIEAPRPKHKAPMRGVIQRPRPDFVFLVEDQLLSHKKILDGESRARSEEKDVKTKSRSEMRVTPKVATAGRVRIAGGF